MILRGALLTPVSQPRMRTVLVCSMSRSCSARSIRKSINIGDASSGALNSVCQSQPSACTQLLKLTVVPIKSHRDCKINLVSEANWRLWAQFFSSSTIPCPLLAVARSVLMQNYSKYVAEEKPANRYIKEIINNGQWGYEYMNFMFAQCTRHASICGAF